MRSLTRRINLFLALGCLMGAMLLTGCPRKSPNTGGLPKGVIEQAHRIFAISNG